MRQIDLVGKSPKEIDNALLASHKEVLNYLKMHKEGKIEWKHFDSIQNYLIEATGYMNKSVSFVSPNIVVSFEENISPSNRLVGRGKNELEAICDACKNFIDTPSAYNTFSTKYVNQLKKEFPDLFK